jgi:AraC-like DNA-binding protein
MEETEDNCPHCPIYFEALARALVVSVLCRVRNPQRPPAPPCPHIPVGIRRAIERLEDDFIENISVTDLADHARLSIDHFARIFRKVTGTTPHQYLLRVRLSHARKLMQGAQAIGLDEVALNCGFCDQAHFGRHFRRYFGITPAAFLHGAPEFPQDLKNGGNVPSLAVSFNTTRTWLRNFRAASGSSSARDSLPVNTNSLLQAFHRPGVGRGVARPNQQVNSTVSSANTSNIFRPRLAPVPTVSTEAPIQKL